MQVINTVEYRENQIKTLFKGDIQKIDTFKTDIRPFVTPLYFGTLYHFRRRVGCGYVITSELIERKCQ